MIVEVRKMFLEVYKMNAKRCGSIEKAIEDGFCIAWEDEKIKSTFNNGRGTLEDLKRHMDANRSLCFFVEV